ncbi:MULTISPECIES: hypothetical protein [Bacillus]|uniref:hypothetical protein n=1 Tax=Bacillus TaxID=1386 RepID=UPI00227F90EF|nr:MULTISPECIES: hypothetical protein [Bacillus]MCY7430816.1 hypothetical protein [Bacillus safensis]MEC1184494.1 hypothetical protein [Bacillus altitudinis]
MQFYKILRQREIKKESFCNLLDMQKYDYITGNYPNSFAIKYNPDTFNQLLNNSAIFREYKSRSIQQLFVTNQKFLTILNYNDFFNIKIANCLFLEDNNNMYLEEYDELSSESVADVVDRYGFNIKEVTFMTNDTKRKIVLQKNGVIGIDNGLTESENSKLLKFIDTLNFGLKVIGT